MSKVLPASCENNIVTVEGQTVEATILSQGTKASEGVVVLEESEATYLTSNATDLVLIIQKLKQIVDKIATTLTDIGTGMTGPTTAPPPTLPTSVIAINNFATELETIKDNLK